ncbi:unnamed protein product [Arabidopsis thaliana]|uniref:PGG domain-containing protein n=1 Tax=Arabidopsis thaliana TaxID=3702 RepID=A0A5S9YGC2_ARATH|nr:unnamed protein product [Arabidopsis thaliana]
MEIEGIQLELLKQEQEIWFQSGVISNLQGLSKSMQSPSTGTQDDKVATLEGHGTETDLGAVHSEEQTQSEPVDKEETSKNFNFNRTHLVDPTLNKAYAKELQLACPTKVDPKVIINIDPVLFTDNRSRPFVDAWANDSLAFNRAFVISMRIKTRPHASGCGLTSSRTNGRRNSQEKRSKWDLRLEKKMNLYGSYLDDIADQIPVDRSRSQMIRKYLDKHKYDYEEYATIWHREEYEESATKIIDLCPSLVRVANVDGNTPLHLAAEIGNEFILWKMLRCGEADCRKINKQGQTAFILACLNNHVAVALTLLQYMRSMTMVELDAAFSRHQPVIIDKMLEKFPSLVLDVDEEQSTLLHKAVTQRNEEYATKVIDLCPSLVSVTNVDGNTPLHLAAEIGNINILWKMLETGEAECMKINKQGQTAFILACLNNNVNSARILVEGTSSMTMVELNAAFSEQQPVIIDSILEKFPNLILDADEEQSTLLHKACKSGNLEMARTLLDVDVNQEIAEKVDKDGLTPLHRAVINGSVEILKEFLCKAPSSFNITTQGTIETVFHLAAKYQKTKAFIFMAQSANIGQLLYSLDAEDNTVLHVAASVDSTSLVRHILSETTIDVTLKNKKGFAAVDLIDKEGVDFPLLSLWFRDEAEKIQRPARYVKFAHEPVELIRNTNNGEKLSSESRAMDLLREGRDPRNKEREMHSESLQNARNTITIVAVLIASVAFTCGINPPGGVHQDGPFIGKATAGRTLAFKIFSVANNIALFTSLSIVTLLVSIISYRTKALKMCVVIAHKMMWLAVASMATAYAASAWITVPHNEGSKWLVYTTSAIASVALGSMFVYVSFMMVKHILKKDKLRRNQSHGKTPSTTLDMEAAGDVGCYWF